ncbi:histidine phosphatase family protein [Paucilactobacillus nenjiangensis]|uniref:histidine phosphatase family protein n=1 Tax=Paucilactobacillus nenjiangensis TaxID=1296540 RepID=UPI0010F7982E|nr:histidine phosphatase family protein [Paucilactobacillus nenjiangensis]
MKTVNVYIVRHGETIFNTLDKLQGWADSPLTDKGIQLAIDTGNTLSNVHFNSAYASDMKRAIDTAKLILKPNKYLSHLNGELPEFREAFFGLFEGLDNMSSWKLSRPPMVLPPKLKCWKKFHR